MHACKVAMKKVLGVSGWLSGSTYASVVDSPL